MIDDWVNYNKNMAFLWKKMFIFQIFLAKAKFEKQKILQGLCCFLPTFWGRLLNKLVTITISETVFKIELQP